MKKVLLLAAAVAATSACAIAPSAVGAGLFARVSEPVLVSGNSGTKTGQACADNYFGIVTMGDMSVQTAKKNGRINTVATVDKVIEGNIVIAKVCTVVTGN